MVSIEIGGEAKVINKLGEGGQDAVYLVEYQGKQYVLKWYFKGRIGETFETQFKQNLAQNVSDGSPSSKFLWPLFLAKPANGSFGYLMEVFGKRWNATFLRNGLPKAVRMTSQLLWSLRRN